MPRELIRDAAAGRFVVREYALTELGPDEVRVQIELAAPKHGTEAHIWSGNVNRGRLWDPSLRLFRDPIPEAPAGGSATIAVGNMAVGTVVEVGPDVTTLRQGDRVYGYMPVREVHHLAAARARLLPPDLAPEAAVCVDPAHVAFVAVRDGNVRLGDWVAVFGLGAIGLLTVQATRAAGAERIVAVDPISTRRERALAMGADTAVDPLAEDAGLTIKEATDGRGVDVALETSGADRAMHEAIRGIMQCGTVVGVGWGSGSGAGLYLGEEFHVNRPTIVASQASSYWGNPDRDYPLWDELRAQRACAELFRRGKLTAQGILDPIVPLDQAPDVLNAVWNNPASVVKVGIRLRG